MMFLGRLVGKALLVLALLMASGEAVMALGLGDHHQGIMASDVWLLLLGHLPGGDFPPLARSLLLHGPAWAMLGPVGLLLAFFCRRRRRNRLFR